MRDAFWKLSTERPLGSAGVGPIPWSKIQKWIEVEGLDDPETFEHMIEKMDNAYLRVAHERRDQEKSEDG